jgi:hypothetical protein
MQLKNRYYNYFLSACRILNVRQDILALRISKMEAGEALMINSYMLKFEGMKPSSEGILYIISIWDAEGKCVLKAPVLLTMPRRERF